MLVLLAAFLADVAATSIRVTSSGEFEEFSSPRPEVSAGEVLVKVTACSVGAADVAAGAGVLGFGGSGIVAASETYAPGDEVWFITDPHREGSNSEFVAVHEHLVSKKPSTLSLTEAGSMALASLQAWEALFESASFERTGKFSQHYLTRGRRLLVLGGGPVAHYAVQMAKNLTELVVASTGLGVPGADVIVDSKQLLTHPDLGVTSVDYVLNLEPLTAQLFEDLVELLRPFGKIIELTNSESALPVHKLVAKRLSLVGASVFMRSLYGVAPETHSVALDMIADFVDSGKISLSATRVLPWSAESLRKAHALVREGTADSIVLSKELDRDDSCASDG